MRFVVDADLPHSVAALIQSYGHDAVHVRDVGLGRASDAEIAARAQADNSCLITGDFDFADIRNYPPGEYSGIVVMSLPRRATAAFILIPTPSDSVVNPDLTGPASGSGDSRIHDAVRREWYQLGRRASAAAGCPRKACRPTGDRGTRQYQDAAVLIYR